MIYKVYLFVHCLWLFFVHAYMQVCILNAFLQIGKEGECVGAGAIERQRIKFSVSSHHWFEFDELDLMSLTWKLLVCP